MCMFEKSVCGCSLRTGCIIIVAYHLFLTLNLIVGSAIVLQQRGSSKDQDYILDGESETMLRTALGFGIISHSLLLILLIGVIKRIPIAAFVLLIYLSIWIVSVLSAIIIFLILDRRIQAVYLLHTVIDVYCCLIVFNYWMEIKEEYED